MTNTMTHQSALEALVEGNARYTANKSTTSHNDQAAARTQTAHAQSPHTIVLACSDSRVPVEMIFDQGIGDLFVIRVAGNIATPSQIGSIEFAIQAFHSSLVVVLGHSDCGAIKATLDTFHAPSEVPNDDLAPAHIGSIVESIRPVLEPFSTEPQDDSLVDRAVSANVSASIAQLLNASPFVAAKVAADAVRVVGGVYDLVGGKVSFQDD